METTNNKRTFVGVVVSDKNDKTIVVQVERKMAHALYGKRITKSIRYKVHDPENTYKVGDEVKFVETRPYSKDKRWIVVSAK